MSIIAAGTTTTTALSSTGNTDGTLQFQVNGTTPSVTLNTLGAIGVGSTPNYGTSGQALVSAGSTAAPTWANVTTSPAGSNTQIQYNNSGSFGASSAFTFDGTTATTPRLALGGTTLPAAGTATLFSRSSDNNTYLQSGSGNTVILLDGSQNSMATFGSSTVQLLTGNTERFRIASAGELGIGGANYGTSGQVLTSGGSGAAPTWSTPAGGFSAMEVITSTQTWTIPAGKTTLKVTVVGGGGGGGGQGSSGSSGGTTTLASGTQTISTITGNGGQGGPANNASAGGSGGAGSGGTLNFQGGAGVAGAEAQYLGGGSGGSSFFGGGGAGQKYSGASGNPYGGGGAGWGGDRNTSPAGGGGGGGTAIKYLTGMTPGNTLTATIGAGGSPGSSGGGGYAGVIVIEY